ncbi:TetR family transcriptional regulator [Rhizocola hellebori]|uniref:TetR family transcriptional regulator n=1 Tax=Rhizocola hellebori TaxID=1392758 RepID=A0A8J3VG08_9ACTN|nr:TetR family transcriptional regulator [Rhizocola hellebori]GIH04990.1 TetR family transcriptional regulator [Rhizocola hellebori]
MIKRSGRRRGSPDTRDSILEAARRLFADKGFDATTVRAIAADAGVDPAMIHHFFGTKEELFRATIQFPIDPTTEIPDIVAGGRDEVGHRLVAAFVRIWDSPSGAVGASIIRSAMSNDWTLRLMREFLTTQIMRRIVAAIDLDPAEAPLRVSLIASQLAGLAIMRYIIKLEPLASLPSEQVVALIGPNVQRYVTGSLTAET